MGAASTLGGLAWLRGTDAALGFPVPAPSPGSLRGRLNPPPPPPLPLRARSAPASPSLATTARARPPLVGKPETKTQASSPRAALPAAERGGGHRALCRARLDRAHAVPYSGEHRPMDPQRGDISHWPLCRGRHDSQAALRPTDCPSLTCLHGVREVVPGGRGPGKFLQFPSAEVQPPRVGGFLQCAFQPPVQG